MYMHMHKLYTFIISETLKSTLPTHIYFEQSKFSDPDRDT